MCLNNCRASIEPKINDLRLHSTDLTDTCEYLDYEDNWAANKTDLLVLQLNIRGVQSKLSELQYLIDNNPCKKVPDVILLCETWQTPSTPSINIPGYNTFSHPRAHKKGGGVAILVGSNIHCKFRNDLTSAQPTNKESKPHTEFCFAEIKTPKKEILIGSMYRPPNVDPRDFLGSYETLINKIKVENKELILGTDHNLDLLKSHTHWQTSAFIETSLDHGIFPTITRPTRLTHTSASLIDNILVTESILNKSDSRILIENISDHLVCMLNVKDLLIKNNTQVEVEYRDMNKEGLKRLNEELASTDWIGELPGTALLDDNMTKFSDLLQTKCDHFLPLRQSKIRAGLLRKEPWVTSGTA